MKSAFRQSLILWLSLLILGGLSFLLLTLPATRTWLWERTGEEEFFAQVKGLAPIFAATAKNIAARFWNCAVSTAFDIVPPNPKLAGPVLAALFRRPERLISP